MVIEKEWGRVPSCDKFCSLILTCHMMALAP